MLRTSLIGITSTLPAAMSESGGFVKATLRPAYVRSGAADYGDIANKPSINGVTLEGDISLSDLGLIDAQEQDIEELFREEQENPLTWR